MKRHTTRYPGVMYRELEGGGRSYLIVYYDALGKKRQKSGFPTEKAALLELGKVREKKHLGSLTSPSKLTVKELAEKWLAVAEGHIKASTLRTYTGSIDTQIVPKLGHLRVQQVGVNQVALFVGELKKTYSSWYIHGTLTPLRQMFEWAKHEQIIATNPVKELSRQQKPSGFTKKVRCLDEGEIAAILRESSPSYKMLFTLLIFSGLRISEALALEWSDIDFEQNLIRVRSGKTEAATRKIAIPLWLTQELAKYWSAFTTRAVDDSVFMTSIGTAMNRHVVWQGWKRTLVRAGVAHASLHDTRHTFASILIGQGEDVTYVADQMGHKDPGVTLRTYMHLFQPEKRRQQARERLERFAWVAA